MLNGRWQGQWAMVLNSLSGWRQKPVLAFGLVLLLVLYHDFAQRVMLVPQTRQQSADHLPPPQPQWLQITEEQKAVLWQQYLPYNRVLREAKAAALAAQQAAKPKPAPQPVDNSQEIAAQHGELTSLLTKQGRFRLRAVVTGEVTAVVLQQANQSGRPTEWVRLQQGDSLFGFELSEIHPTRVTFTRADQRIDLLMYQP